MFLHDVFACIPAARIHSFGASIKPDDPDREIAVMLIRVDSLARPPSRSKKSTVSQMGQTWGKMGQVPQASSGTTIKMAAQASLWMNAWRSEAVCDFT
jgi:hypothetical protein